MKTTTKKDFDAVAFMRQERDRISQEIADLDFGRLKKYFAKNRSGKRIMPAR